MLCIIFCKILLTLSKSNKVLTIRLYILPTYVVYRSAYTILCSTVNERTKKKVNLETLGLSNSFPLIPLQWSVRKYRKHLLRPHIEV